jgi:hypothetical protein
MSDDDYETEYDRRRIAIALGVIGIIFLSGFTIWYTFFVPHPMVQETTDVRVTSNISENHTNIDNMYRFFFNNETMPQLDDSRLYKIGIFSADVYFATKMAIIISSDGGAHLIGFVVARMGDESNILHGEGNISLTQHVYAATLTIERFNYDIFLFCSNMTFGEISYTIRLYGD